MLTEDAASDGECDTALSPGLGMDKRKQWFAENKINSQKVEMEKSKKSSGVEVFVTRRTMATGTIERRNVEIGPDPAGKKAWVYMEGKDTRYEGSDWHRTEAKAVEHAKSERMRLMRKHTSEVVRLHALKVIVE